WGGGLRGFLLAPAFGLRDGQAFDDDLDQEAFAVVGADLRGEAIGGQAAAARLPPFLQRRLPVVGERRLGAGAVRLLDQLLELRLDEPARRLGAAVEINRGNQ